MLSITDLKSGVVFLYNNNPHLVIFAEHSKIGRGGAILRSKIKNLITGVIIEKTFKGSDNFEEINIERRKAQFLYKESQMAYFMDLENYEQFSISNDVIGNKINYLKEGEQVTILFYESKPISVDVPIKVSLEVTYTEPGFKGNTQSTTTKDATLETGANTQVPLFISIGDKIIIDTRNGNYIERTN